ncbi:16S rRNA (guanine(966)-N(2))-methyltransferase RsmD [Alteromonas aestuariivivens]|uniref:Ribosomal RNA small subunit methyltransferase D n=1 Tax=Alteromonas aestuariivivens TaxID=1938339 RepID=A0A3D8M387_9ALTE|nr:16S rRNA (guanine(966)-N(2))-methyltransferase RsmD [Alteromonas aestuariivivens]RDV24197.1 16S rRNA (guanine(966)-N(2))-methyltransferase RsmD [Alteromonas aestuariivivens]
MKRARKTPQSRNTPNGSVRVISGRWRGRKLPVADVEGLRPTTDRNKETLFNWLMQDIAGARCLDVFAGSGGLGIEALSRYAEHCTFIEFDKAAATNLKRNLQTLEANSQVHIGDALNILPQLSGPFEIIFVDPPFHMGLVAPTLDSITSRELVTPGGFIYLEQEAALPLPSLPGGYSILRQKSSSQVCYCLIMRDGSVN